MKAWEAVALSLNIEPRKVRVNRAAWMAGPGGNFLHEEGAEFDDRLEVLRRNITKFDLVSIIMGEPDRCEIRLGQFVAWAKAIGWTMPPELEATPEGARTKPNPPTADISTAERNSLLKLVIGMAVGGYGFDPSAGKSPAPPDIAADLEKLGIALDADTVRKYLREGAALLPSQTNTKPRKG